MYLVPRNLKTVVIESPYDTIHHPEVRDLFGRVVGLKILGYRNVYPYGVLPVDTYDYVATHFLICEETDNGLEPVTGYKSLSLKKSIKHQMTFQGIAVLESSGALHHIRALKSFLEQCEQENRSVCYGSSWTIHPKFRDTPELRPLMRDVSVALLANSVMDQGVTDHIMCGTPKVKTDALLKTWGYEPMMAEGIELPYFYQKSLMNEPAQMFVCKRFSDYALDLAKKYRELWDSRLVYAPELDQASAQKAA